MTKAHDAGTVAGMSDDWRRVYRAALYAAGTYYRMLDADVSWEEVKEVIDFPPETANKITDLAALTLVADGSHAALATIHGMQTAYGAKHAVAELDEKAYGRIAHLASEIGGMVTHGHVQEPLEAANRWLGLHTVEGRRVQVLQSIVEYAREDATEIDAARCLAALVEYDAGFSKLAISDVRGVLRRADLDDENSGGRTAAGMAKLGLFGAAAALAVPNAFGDLDKKKSKALFEQAWKAHLRRVQTRRESILSEMAKREPR